MVDTPVEGDLADEEYDDDVAPDIDPVQDYRRRYALLASNPDRTPHDEEEMQGYAQLLAARGIPVESIPTLWRPE